MEVDADVEGATGGGAAAAAAEAGAAAALSDGAAPGALHAAGTVAVAAPAAASSATGAWDKYEWVKFPAPVVQHARLRLVCSVLRLEACSDSSFQVCRRRFCQNVRVKF